MTIVSRYWREELFRIRKSLIPKKRPPRFTERRICLVERDTMVGFFIVRRLIELSKVGSKSINHLVPTFRNRPIKSINWSNKHCVWENYDWGKEVKENIPICKVANQFIHSVHSDIQRDKARNWCDFYIYSDYEQKKSILRVPVKSICDAFDTIANDWTLRRLTTRYNSQKKDHDLDWSD